MISIDDNRFKDFISFISSNIFLANITVQSNLFYLKICGARPTGRVHNKNHLELKSNWTIYCAQERRPSSYADSKNIYKPIFKPKQYAPYLPKLPPPHTHTHTHTKSKINSQMCNFVHLGWDTIRIIEIIKHTLYNNLLRNVYLILEISHVVQSEIKSIYDSVKKKSMYNCYYWFFLVTIREFSINICFKSITYNINQCMIFLYM